MLSAQAGVACGIRDDSGIAQLRLNNLLTNGSVDFKGHIRIPLDQVPDEMLLCQGDVLFNNTNSVELVGKTVYFDGHSEKVTFSNHVTRLRVKTDELSPEYLALWLQHQWRSKVFEGICDRWIGQAAVQKGKLEALEIETPVLEDQRQIAARLKAQLTEVETARQAVLVQVRDAALLCTTLIDAAFSKCGQWHPITAVAKVQSGYAFKSEHFAASGVRLLRNTNILPGKVYWDDTVCIDEYESWRYPSYALEAGDILISLDRPLISSGIKVARVSASDLPALLLQRVGRFLLKPGLIDPSFLYAFLQSSRFIKAISGHDQSLGVPHISPGQVEAVMLPLVSLGEQRKIASHLKTQLAEADTIVQTVTAQLAEIERLPQRLLAQAFNNLETTP